MKKIVLLTKYFSPHVGGVETHVQELATRLAERGYAVTVITNQHKQSLSAADSAIFEIRRIPFSAIDRKILTWLWMLRHIRTFVQADIIHAHDIFWWIAPLRLILFWKKYFITFHGYEGVEPPSAKKIIAHKIWNELSHGSLAIGAFHNKWYQLKTTAISYGAIHHNQHSSPAKKPRTTRHIIYIGRLAEDVGIMHYLEAVRMMSNSGPITSLDVYGDGPQLEQAEDYVRKHSLNVRFHGFIPSAEKYLPKYDVAYVSRYLAILSALAIGRPIVAHTNNKIKYDYLAMAPFSKWISIAKNSNEIVKMTLRSTKVDPKSITWAKKQTWENLTNLYEKIWKI